MITEDKVIEIFYMSNEYSKEFSKVKHKYSLGEGCSDGRRHRNKPNRMSDAEIMVILILFHTGGFRCFKHFYLGYVCRHMRHLFPRVVSYSRFVELEKEVAVCLCLVINDRGEILNFMITPGNTDDREPQLVTRVRNNMRNMLMSAEDKILLRKRAVIETVNDELKNIAQIEHSRHRSFNNFIVNILSAIAAYCFFPKKPAVDVAFVDDEQLVLF